MSVMNNQKNWKLDQSALVVKKNAWTSNQSTGVAFCLIEGSKQTHVTFATDSGDING